MLKNNKTLQERLGIWGKFVHRIISKLQYGQNVWQAIFGVNLDSGNLKGKYDMCENR